MALEDNLKQESTGKESTKSSLENMSDEEEADLEIAVLLAKRLIDDGGIEVINQAMNSRDPGQVIGQFLMQLVSQMNESLPPNIQLSKRIYFAYGGWIEQISDYLQEEYDIPQDIMDRAEMFIGAQAQAMAQGGAQQQAAPGAAPAPAPAGAPPVPQTGGMQ